MDSALVEMLADKVELLIERHAEARAENKSLKEKFEVQEAELERLRREMDQMQADKGQARSRLEALLERIESEVGRN